MSTTASGVPSSWATNPRSVTWRNGTATSRSNLRPSSGMPSSSGMSRELLETAQRPTHERDRRALPQPDHRPRLVPRQLLEGCCGGGGLGHAGNATRSGRRARPACRTRATADHTIWSIAWSAGQAGHVGEPDQRLDPAHGTHRDGQPAYAVVAELPGERVERLGEPTDRTALPERELAGGGVRLQREPQHRALLGLGVDHHRHEAPDRHLDAFLGILAHLFREHRRRVDLRVRGEQQRLLRREVAVGRGAGDQRGLGRLGDRGRSTGLGHQLSRRRHQGSARALLLPGPPGLLVRR